MADRSTVFLDYYDRERVQQALVFFRHRAAALARGRRGYRSAVALLLAMGAVGAIVAFGFEPARTGDWPLWLAVVGPASALALIGVGGVKAGGAELERCRLAYIDLERLRVEGAPDAGSTGASRTELEAYVNQVEAFLSAAPHGG